MLLLAFISTILGLQPMHEAGYRGQGMTIAIIDCGFYRANDNSLFRQDHIIGSYDLLREDSLSREDMFSNPYDTHGANCLSLMMYESEEFTGTAPDANYILIRTEDLSYEYRGEVDRLERGLLLADELGADVISISLGYATFDNGEDNFTYEDLNGQSSIAKTANTLAHKGRLIVVAAGNYGNNTWHYLTAPADADSVLTVGACNEEGEAAPFSGWGPTADGRQKPEVAAWGWHTRVPNLENGTIGSGNGTSYATPEMAGMAACLWQALPDKNAMQIRDLIIASATNYPDADYQLGYGIPDAYKAYLMAQHGTGWKDLYPRDDFRKVLINGKMYILKNGVRYNLMGMEE